MEKKEIAIQRIIEIINEKDFEIIIIQKDVYGDFSIEYLKRNKKIN